MEIKELLELNENVLLGLQRIQADLPELRNLKEESYKNLSAMEIRIEDFKNVAGQVEKKSEGLSAAISEVRQASWDGLAKIKAESEKAERAYVEFEKSVEESRLNEEVEEKLEKIETLAAEHAGILDILMKRIGAMDAKIYELEEKLKNVDSKQMISIPSVVEDTVQNAGEASKFPKNAYRFSFDNIESVKSTKPYGIIFGNEIMKCQNWTDMLKLVIKYGFDNYEIDIDDLCDQGFGMESYNGEFIPYFIIGGAPSKKYTYIPKQNFSVYFSGADSIVDVIHDFLCDYLEVEESKVIVFYHYK